MSFLEIINANSTRIPLTDNSVDMVATSPPYWALRDYGVDNQIGLEDFHDCLAWARNEPPCNNCYICQIRKVGAEIYRVLANHGTFWLNLGDSYGGSGKGGGDNGVVKNNNHRVTEHAAAIVPPKCLALIPQRAALALQYDGWIVRSNTIWHKSNCLPENVTDRPANSHEYIILMSKKRRYFYDHESIKVSAKGRAGTHNDFKRESKEGLVPGRTLMQHRADRRSVTLSKYVNRRSVWTIPTAGYSGAHFATWPPDLVKLMILAGTSQRGCCSECGRPWVRVTKKGKAGQTAENPNPVNLHIADPGKITNANGGEKSTLHMSREIKTLGWAPTCNCQAPTRPAVVLDPFNGSGTTGMVARDLGRSYIGLDINIEYLREITRQRWGGRGHKAPAVDLSSLPLFNY